MIFLRPLIVLLLVFFLSSLSHHALAKDSPDEVDKRALVIQIEKDINERIQSLEAFQKELKGAKPPEFAIDPDRFIRSSKQQIADLQAFLVVVQKQEPKDVPQFLADTFSSCDDQGICAYKLHPDEIDGYVVSYGARALDVIQARFDALAPFRKESALHLFLRIQPLSCPDSVLKRAIGDDVFRVRFSALRVYRGNCPPDEYNGIEA